MSILYLLSLAATICTLHLTSLTAAGAPPAWYSCTCGSKSGDPSPPLVAPCVCPSTNAPGGLSRSETPQFILLTVCRLIA